MPNALMIESASIDPDSHANPKQLVVPKIPQVRSFPFQIMVMDSGVQKHVDINRGVSLGVSVRPSGEVGSFLYQIMVIITGVTQAHQPQ